ncbi:phage tail tube protein [Rhodopila sp.]|uniref:phage tail tube protein n=1 Tax=Rhodopila sp. TaxID=2480087 RepID=UPI003D0C1CA9
MSVGVSYGGTAQFTVGGTLYSLAGSIKVDPGGIIKTPAIGPSGPTGNWTEKYDPPMIEVELFDDPAQSVTTLRGVVGVTIQAQNRNGKTWVLRNGFVADKIDLDLISGKYTIKFSGTDVQELLP